MNYLSNKIAKELKNIASELAEAKDTKRHDVRCKIESIKDARDLAEHISGELSL